MRTTHLLFLVSTLLPVTGIADEFSLRRSDHQLHLAASYGLTVSSYAVFRKAGASKLGATILSLVTVNGLGLLKELNDKRFSTGDLTANAIGSSLGGGFMLTLGL